MKDGGTNVCESGSWRGEGGTIDSRRSTRLKAQRWQNYGLNNGSCACEEKCSKSTEYSQGKQGREPEVIQIKSQQFCKENRKSTTMVKKQDALQ
eukprot:TRINITY_DN68173_c0_g1_i1.p1 TRINITY_DN68173_c0_g1~~TRINITY_DN68173_c0_g1_i1.p1  ORF type:complete len:109 (-),score=15.65 TRINITY_DN68173_c0_g1_i1:276-557(-)